MELASRDLLESYRSLLAENPKLRAREAAEALRTTEAELFEAKCGENSCRRLRPVAEGFFGFLQDLGGSGEFMSLVHNGVAVHEKYGDFADCAFDPEAGEVSGPSISFSADMNNWIYGFAEAREITVRRRQTSLHFFDAHGVAVYALYSSNHTDQAALDEVLSRWVADDLPPIEIDPAPSPISEVPDGSNAFQISKEIVTRALESAAEDCIPVAITVATGGCTQRHDDVIKTVRPKGPWINVFDKKFHMHLHRENLTEVWCVAGEGDQGRTRSLNVFDSEGRRVFRMAGSSNEGAESLGKWSALLDDLLQGWPQ